MKVAELRQKTSTELQTLLSDLLRELFGLRMQRASGQLANNSRFKEIRKEVARIKTIVSERLVSEGNQS